MYLQLFLLFPLDYLSLYYSRIRKQSQITLLYILTAENNSGKICFIKTTSIVFICKVRSTGSMT